MMNALRFDAITLGNHDLDCGLTSLTAQLGELDSTLLCANLQGYPGAQPTMIVTIRGERVAIVGVTLGEMHLLQPDRNIEGLRFLDPVAVLRELIPSLRAQVDYVILLSHCGFETDQAIAQAVEGIDLIVGGHSHHRLPSPVQVGQTWVVQAGSGARELGWVSLSRSTGELRVTGGLLSTAGVVADPLTLSLIPPAASPDQANQEILGHTRSDLRRESYAQETPLANWTADAWRAYAQVDVALVRAASVANRFGPGPLRRQDVKQMSWIGSDRLATLELLGSELKAVLECGARDSYYLVTTSGARAVYDADQPEGARVTYIEVGGQPLEPDRVYSVVCSEIMARGGAGFTPMVGRPYQLLDATVEQVLTMALAAQGLIAPRVDGRLCIRGVLPCRSA